MSFMTFTPGSVLTATQVNDYLMKQSVIVCTSGTRPGSPVEGMTVYETDTNRYMLYNGVAWDYAFCGTVVKVGDEGVTNNTIQDDNNLVLPVQANTVYIVDAMIKYDALPAADIKIGWTLPTSADFDWYGDGIDTAFAGGGSAGFQPLGRGLNDGTGTPSSGGVASGVNVMINPRGRLITAGSAGNVQFRFAQVTTNATQTRVRGGSMLTIYRVG